MKKKLVFFMILLLILCSSVTIVQAAGEKITFEPSTNQLKQGETFTVTLHGESSDGINMITVNYHYDEEKLELVNYRLPDGYTDWTGEGKDELVMMITNGDIITSTDSKLTFKVKEDATDSETGIKFEQIGMDTFANSNHRFHFDDSEISIKIGEKTQSYNTIIIVIIAIVVVLVIAGIVLFMRKRK